MVRKREAERPKIRLENEQTHLDEAGPESLSSSSHTKPSISRLAALAASTVSYTTSTRPRRSSGVHAAVGPYDWKWASNKGKREGEKSLSGSRRMSELVAVTRRRVGVAAVDGVIRSRKDYRLSWSTIGLGACRAISSVFEAIQRGAEVQKQVQRRDSLLSAPPLSWFNIRLSSSIRIRLEGSDNVH